MCTNIPPPLSSHCEEWARVPRIGTRVLNHGLFNIMNIVRPTASTIEYPSRGCKSFISMDSVVVSSRTSTPCRCCCPRQRRQQQRSKIFGAGDDDDDDDVCGRRNNNSGGGNAIVVNARTECRDESTASVSAAVAIEEEGGGDTSNHFDYWRVLNGIISSMMMFDNHHTNAKQPRGRDRVTTTATTTNSYYTLTEVRTHNTIESAWILVGNTIYDVTTYISDHPGGASSILRKCGGSVDCTRDFNFHSKRARREWKRYKVGILLTT